MMLRCCLYNSVRSNDALSVFAVINMQISYLNSCKLASSIKIKINISSNWPYSALTDFTDWYLSLEGSYLSFKKDKEKFVHNLDVNYLQ